MFQRVMARSVSFVGCNEDTCSVGRRHLLVLDGASPLTGLHLTGEKSDARWFAQRVRRRLALLLKEEDTCTRPLEELLLQAVRGLIRRYDSLAPAPLQNADTPSAGLALFRQRGGQIDFYGLGDCIGSVRRRDGQVEILRDPALPGLDERAIGEMCLTAERENISNREARQKIGDILIENRNLKNRPGGYYVLDTTRDWVGHGVERTFDAAEIESLAVMTDGFAQLCEFSLVPGYAQLHERLLQGEANALFRLLTETMQNDPDYQRYPRFKLLDDTTAAAVRVLPD